MAAARKLLRRAERERAGRFLIEGARAVREALDWSAERGGGLHELFVTARAAARHPELVEAARATGARVSEVTERAAASLAETTTPQGLVAVCATLTGRAGDAVRGARLVAVLAGVSDPGNAGTVIRTADAAAADAVLLTGDTVDVHNGKCVRASAGSVFHLPLAPERDPEVALAACRDAGLRLLAADGAGAADLDELAEAGDLREPTAWLFGSESHGLPPTLLLAADASVRVPLYGRAESLNLAAAAAVCLYASARAQRGAPARRHHERDPRH